MRKDARQWMYMMEMYRSSSGNKEEGLYDDLLQLR